MTENFFYRPTTRVTNQVYEQLLVVLQQQLGDQPDEVLRGAADEVLQVLKEDGLKEGERKRGVEGVLGPITQERFTKLFQLSKSITDFMGADQDRDEGGTLAFKYWFFSGVHGFVMCWVVNVGPHTMVGHALL